MIGTPVPMYDLKREYLRERETYISLFDEVCASARFADGAYVRAFEAAFGNYLGGLQVSGVGSGTDALFLTLKAYGVGPGDEVIVPAATFTATPGAVAMTGAVPVFADIEPDTWEISPAEVRRLLTTKTKAVLGVHLYGNLFDTEAILQIAREAGVPLIEDCAQAAGARYRGVPAGALCDAACFSFYPTKNLGAFGEGGAVASADARLVQRADHLKKHARTPEGDHTDLGYNMRMQGLQGAVLTHKLGALDAFTARKNEIAARYRDALENHPRLTYQAVRPGVLHAYHLFVVKTDDRARFQTYMEKRGIETGVQYPIPCHLQQAFAAVSPGAGALPATEALFAACVSVPSYPYLTDEEVEAVCFALKEYR